MSFCIMLSVMFNEYFTMIPKSPASLFTIYRWFNGTFFIMISLKIDCDMSRADRACLQDLKYRLRAVYYFIFILFSFYYIHFDVDFKMMYLINEDAYFFVR